MRENDDMNDEDKKPVKKECLGTLETFVSQPADQNVNVRTWLDVDAMVTDTETEMNQCRLEGAASQEILQGKKERMKRERGMKRKAIF